MADEDLIANIELDTSKSVDNIDMLNDRLRQNAKQTRAIEKELKKLEKEYKSIATAVKKVPVKEIDRLSKQVKKSDKALTALGGQLEKTSKKMERVRDRTFGATDSFAALAASITVIGSLSAISDFADKIVKATNAIINLNTTLVPTIEKIAKLSGRGLIRLSDGFTKAKITVLSASSALTEQVALFKGIGTSTQRTEIFLKRFNETMKSIGSSASFVQRSISTLNLFMADTKDRLARVQTLLRAVGDGFNKTRNFIVQF